MFRVKLKIESQGLKGGPVIKGTQEVYVYIF